ncbi:MAG: hypothetical protein OEZ13_13695, partial [Spirochaetia bacterium]|nr:hypothetical protein [Spirochaetia bacterium]
MLKPRHKIPFFSKIFKDEGSLSKKRNDNVSNLSYEEYDSLSIDDIDISDNNFSNTNKRRSGGLLERAKGYKETQVSNKRKDQSEDKFPDDSFSKSSKSDKGFHPLTGIKPGKKVFFDEDAELEEDFDTSPKDENRSDRDLPDKDQRQYKRQEDDAEDEDFESKPSEKSPKRKKGKKGIITYRSNEIISRNSPFGHHHRSLVTAERFLAEKEFEMSLEMYERLLQKIPNKTIAEKIEQNIQDIEDHIENKDDYEDESTEPPKIIVQLQYPPSPSGDSPDAKEPEKKPFAEAIVEFMNPPVAQKKEAEPIKEEDPNAKAALDDLPGEPSTKPRAPELQEQKAQEDAVQQPQEPEAQEQKAQEDTAQQPQEPEAQEQKAEVEKESPELPDKPGSIIKELFQQIAQGIFDIQNAVFKTKTMTIQADNIETIKAPETQETSQEPQKESTEAPESTQEPQKESPESQEATQEPQKEASEAPKSTQEPQKESPESQEAAQEPQKEASEAPKSTQEPQKESPESQEAAQEPQKEASEALESTQEPQKESPESQEAAQEPQKESPEALESTQEPQK